MKQMIPPLIKYNLLILIVFLYFPAKAQELPPPEENEPTEAEDSTTDDSRPKEGITAEDFLDDSSLPYTGTLDSEDEDNTVLQTDRELFGSEEEETVEEKALGESHLLKFRFVSHVQFINAGEPSPYLELEYTNTFEVPVTMKQSRFTATIPMTFDVQKWGYLAQNELFSCDLDISMQEVPVEITTRLTKPTSKEGESDEEEESTEEEEKPPSAAVKISLGNDIKEDWFSYCTDLTGAALNTQGDTEAYNLMILKAIEPSLSALVIQEFVEDETAEIELMTPPIKVEDNEIINDIFLSGEGNLTIELLE